MLTLTIATSAANAFTYTGTLVASNTLTVVGSSTVYPMATEEQTGGATGGMAFNTYWNALPANTGAAAVQINSFNIQGAGSGTAIPAINGAQADIGEMSKAPSSGTGSEWASNPTLQDWAVGVDSVVIILSPDMASWFPSSLTTLQVAELFSNSTPFANNYHNGTITTGGDAGMYTTWGHSLAQTASQQPQHQLN